MKLVKESIKENKIIRSAGLIIIQDNKILLGHPTGNKWYASYSIPKGKIELTETPLEAAIRETKEEVGLNISVFDIDVENIDIIDFKDKNGNIYKQIYCYVAKPKDIIIIDKNLLQKEEIDWADFLSKKEAEKRINPKLKDILKYLE